jgi:hypothetical protein
MDMKQVEHCTLNNQQLIDIAKVMVSKLCSTGGRSWTMRVPVDFDRDDDMILSELISRFEAATQVEAMTCDGWQLIESAPKDGTSILAYNGCGEVAAIYWDDGFRSIPTGCSYQHRPKTGGGRGEMKKETKDQIAAIMLLHGDHDQQKEAILYCSSGEVVKENEPTGEHKRRESAPSHPKVYGWICPVCGKGNSPFSSSCPCVSAPFTGTAKRFGGVMEIKNCPFCESKMKTDGLDIVHPVSWCILSGSTWPIENLRTWNKRADSSADCFQDVSKPENNRINTNKIK